jgi:hypothetical protein
MARRQFGRDSGTRVQWCKWTSQCAVGPDDATSGSQRGSAGARLEGGRSTGIALTRGLKPEQWKGNGFERNGRGSGSSA